ncbi:MAG: hypothetical protein K2N72_08015 [Oscillospiraceae bacterium]|nr:hypothetical protein [Oscillospiraceae bacterium]
MKCPYCGDDMEEGHIAVGGELWWQPGRKTRLLNSWFYNDGVVLGENGFGETVTAYLCRECKKVVIDFEKQNCE